MSRLALATIAATFVLILVGGVVTNTGAGLTVPDWPTTFGHNMFLFPWSGMVGGIFYEHTHRLIGSVVGLLTLGLAAALWRRGPLLRGLGVLAVVMVVVQGVLGGLRVVLLNDALALVHGTIAQAFFGLLVAIALLTARESTTRPDLEPRLRALVFVVAGLVYLQLVSGALLTHARHLDLHVFGAMAVYALLPQVALRVGRTRDRVAATTARALLVLLAVQLVLGAGSFFVRFASLSLPGDPASALALPVAHRVVGTLIFGAAVVLAIRARLAGRAVTATP
ncbi:MAG: COX15/CtaA family protein [Candidatus Rokubacteria bacterium]|nr:COX15/CtaA family protein [Candidatus Rokubacteria bacterium]